MLNYIRLLTVFLVLIAARPVAAQIQQIQLGAPSLPASSPFLGGVPQGTATAEPMTLTLPQAIARALDHNLGVLLSEQNVASARGDRWNTLAGLLPNVSGTITQSRRKSNLEAFGFPLGPEFPRVVGPFNVFDARVSVSQPLFDLSAMNLASAASHRLAAARLTYRSARDLVVLVSANLYLQALANDARAAAAQAQFTSAAAIHRQAVDLRQSGIVAGLDVVRAEVRMSADRQRLTAARHDAEKAKLQLARMIGLPAGQRFSLADDIPMVPDPTVTLEQALADAYTKRADYLAALERLRAAEASRRAASLDGVPSVHLVADYGVIGLSAASALSTFNVTGAVDVPLFDGGRRQGRVITADAELRRQQAEVADLRSEIDYDVRAAFLDLEATQQGLETAGRARDLANQQLTQSRDRFAAGVAGNVEVIQAQEAVAVATDQFISATYGFTIAKALLAQSMGMAEEAVRRYLGGSIP